MTVDANGHWTGYEFQPDEYVLFNGLTSRVHAHGPMGTYKLRTSQGDTISNVPEHMIKKMAQPPNDQPSDIDRIVEAINNLSKKLDHLTDIMRTK